jgi:hypothetical protein
MDLATLVLPVDCLILLASGPLGPQSFREVLFWVMVPVYVFAVRQWSVTKAASMKPRPCFLRRAVVEQEQACGEAGRAAKPQRA